MVLKIKNVQPCSVFFFFFFPFRWWMKVVVKCLRPYKIQESERGFLVLEVYFPRGSAPDFFFLVL